MRSKSCLVSQCSLRSHAQFVETDYDFVFCSLHEICSAWKLVWSFQSTVLVSRKINIMIIISNLHFLIFIAIVIFNMNIFFIYNNHLRVRIRNWLHGRPHDSSQRPWIWCFQSSRDLTGKTIGLSFNKAATRLAGKETSQVSDSSKQDRRMVGRTSQKPI